MKTKNKKLLLFIITAFIVLLAYGNFFKFHLVSDAYRIIDNNNLFMMNLKCNEGRPFQVLYFFLLQLFGFSINSIDMYMLLYRINLTGAIILLIITILLAYKLLKNSIKTITNKTKFIVYTCTLLMFINISVSEYMLYIENVIMVFGLFSATLAAYIYNSNIKSKNIIAPVLILLSSFCYQGLTQIFVVLSTLALLLNKQYNKQTDCLRELCRILFLYLLPLVINYLICWLLNSLLPNIDPRVFTGVLSSLLQLVSSQNILVITIYALLYGFIIMFNPKVFMGENFSRKSLNIFYLMILSIISFEIFVFNNSVRLHARTMLNFIIIYPVLKIYIINLKENSQYVIDIIICIVLLISSILFIRHLQNESAISTIQNINVVNSIVEKIDRYETENNIKIQNVAFHYDASTDGKYWNAESIIYYAYTSPIYYGYWCDIYSINVLSNDKYNKIDYTNTDTKIYEYFSSQDWHEPDVDEQVVFKGNTAHICCF